MQLHCRRASSQARTTRSASLARPQPRPVRTPATNTTPARLLPPPPRRPVRRQPCDDPLHRIRRQRCSPMRRAGRAGRRARGFERVVGVWGLTHYRRIVMAKVSLDWYWNRFSVDDDLKTIMQRTTENIARGCYKPESLARSVYVIRLAGPFLISYPKGPSPVIYIGKGQFRNRISAHRTWIRDFFDHLKHAQFEIRYCIPRVKNNLGIEKEVEAYLIHRFIERYGMLPINNKVLSNTNVYHQFIPANSLDKAISIGSGNKPHWEVCPLRSNPWFKKYSQNMAKQSSPSHP